MTASPPGLLFRGLAPPSCQSQKPSTLCSPQITGVCALTSCAPPPRILLLPPLLPPPWPRPQPYPNPDSLSMNSLVSYLCQHLPKAFTPQNQVSRSLDEASRSFSILFPCTSPNLPQRCHFGLPAFASLLGGDLSPSPHPSSGILPILQSPAIKIV